MNYGISYKGSKTGIVNELVSVLPSGNRFVDLFGGGFAVSHYILVNHIYNNQLLLFGKKWNSLLYNDYNPLVVDLIKRAIQGEFNYNKKKIEWISSEDFVNLKDKDGYVKYIWSFGNNGKDYLYGKEIEPYKKACHYAIVFDEWDLLKELCSEVWEVAYNNIKNIEDIKQRRLGFAPPIVKELKRLNDYDLVLSNPLYKSCHWRGGLNSSQHQDLQSLERLQSLQSLERLEITNMSYIDYKYKDGDIVYCDIPYEDTDDYDNQFNHKEFYDWAYNNKFPVYFSSYDNISDERFIKIWEKDKRCTFSKDNNSLIKKECIYYNGV